MRPASTFSIIQLSNSRVSDRLVVDGKSILGVLSLNCDQDLHVRYDGTAPHFEEVLGKFAVA